MRWRVVRYSKSSTTVLRSPSRARQRTRLRTMISAASVDPERSFLPKLSLLKRQQTPDCRRRRSISIKISELSRFLDPFAKPSDCDVSEIVVRSRVCCQVAELSKPFRFGTKKVSQSLNFVNVNDVKSTAVVAHERP